MRGRLVCVPIVLVLSLAIRQPLSGYPAQLFLDGDLEPGAGQTITGGGAPVGPGIWVELWRVAPGTSAAMSVASVQAVDGFFSFAGIDVAGGESYHVTLSRSWNFAADGDAEGWDAITTDVTLDVSGGALNLRIDGADPHVFNFFDYDPHFYRVIEVRLLNPAPAAFEGARQDLAVLWGDFATTVSLHAAEIPTGSMDYETILIPMNVGEMRILPEPPEKGLDGLWATGPRDVLRIDPLDPAGPGAVGHVFQIDSIRIREDYRLDFHIADDPSGIGVFSDMESLVIDAGALSYTVAAGPSVDPFLLLDLATGRLESGHFTRFAIGFDDPLVAQPANSVSLLFNDDDSGVDYLDDGGTAQVARFPLVLEGREDAAFEVDLHTQPPGEWTEDGRAPVQGLRVDVPDVASSGDAVRIDYLGLIPESPYGPSAPAFVRSNTPPIAVILTDPDPAVVFLGKRTASVVLDGSQSDDGDGGTQGLTFLWEKLSGPDGDTILDPDQPTVAVVFTSTGLYTYRLTVDDGQPVGSSASATVTVTVKKKKWGGGDDDDD